MDRLGFKNLAKSMTKTIHHSFSLDSGMVFALYAPWGSGKTTCLNFIKNYIDNEYEDSEKPVILNFNPWWFSGRSDLLKQFFRELKLAIGKKETLKNVSEKIAMFGDLVSNIPEPRAKIFGSILSLFRKQDMQVEELKEEIISELKNKNARILVIIDDIDRLPAEELRDIFRVINAVADFPNIIYLLAFDKKPVVKGLKKFQGIPGEDYLEKIIQVPYDLPLPDRFALRKIFIDIIDKVFTGTEDELLDNTYFGNVFWDGIYYYLNTMRNVKRLTNVIKANYPSVINEVNPVDFLAIETLRVFAPKVYYLIRSNPDMFVGASADKYQNPSMEQLKSFHENWLNKLCYGEEQEVVKSIVIRIFPRVNSVFNNINYGMEFGPIWKKNLNICSPDIFPVYFKFSLPEGEISNAELKSILALGNDQTAFEKKLIELLNQIRPDGSTRAGAFLDRLLDYTYKEIPKKHIQPILNALFNVGDELLVSSDETGSMFKINNDIRIGQILFSLLKRLDSKEERFEVLKEVFENCESVTIIVNEIAVLGQQHGKYGAESKDKDSVVSIEHVEKLEKIGLQKIKQAAKNETLIDKPQLASIFFRWRDWEEENAPRKWILDSNILMSDENLVNLLLSFMSKSSSQSINDKVPKTEWKIRINDLNEFLDLSAIIDRCKWLINNPPIWLQGEKKIAIETFIREYVNQL